MIAEALELHKNYIMEQVLALDMAKKDAVPDALTEDIGDGQVSVAVAKV